MSTIVLSSPSFCRRQEIAERVSRKLGCVCLGPEIEAEAASMAGVSWERMHQALSYSSSPLTLRARAREKHLAYFRAALVAALGRGNVLYSGDFGHLLAPEVSHILRVGLTTDLEARALRRAEEEDVSAEQARELILKDDAQRMKWYRKVFDVDGGDSSLFDLVVDVSRHGIDEACGIIESTAREVRFQPVTYSLKSLRDHELACRVKAALIEELGALGVTSKDGEVTIRSKALSRSKKADSVRRGVMDLEGVDYVVFE